MIFLVLFTAVAPAVSFSAIQTNPKFGHRISVQQIDDRSASSRSDSCEGFGVWSSPGEVVRELAIAELVKDPALMVVEREKLEVLKEQEIEGTNLDIASAPKKKKFFAANLSLAGVISEFEWCKSREKFGVDVGDLLGFERVGLNSGSSKAHVAIELRLIDVQTTKILKTFRAEGESNADGIGIDLDAFGVRMSREQFQKSPLGKATRIAVEAAASEVKAYVKDLP